MVSKIYSAALQGLEARIIEIEVATSQGLRAFNIVGLADTAIKEAKERVNAAIKTAGLKAPQHQAKRVLVNLAPADLKKEGSLYDLPIALAFLLADEQARFDYKNKIILGELALDGTLKPIKGALSFALLAKEQGLEEIILPKQNAKEAALSAILKNQTKIRIIGANSLREVILHLEKREEIIPLEINLNELETPLQNFEIEFGWVKGQYHAKKGLVIAAAGGHNLLFQGPPGAGKTILAKSIVSILPKLTFEELLELTKIYSITGLLKQGKFLMQRPFRNPHHSCSEVALIGGGQPPRPGEISLAHRGILFLDEFPEFHRDLLESLRTPLEEGTMNIQRARYDLTFPANFTLIAAANPCPCGYHNDPERECSCTPSQVASYRRKLSGPLMDRLDIFIDVPSLKYEELIAPEKGNASDEARQKIAMARNIQRQRFKDETILTNSEMKIPHIKKYCEVPSDSQSILRKYIDSGKLSARGYHRILKVARTIADLKQRDKIAFQDISEALSYRLRREEK